MNEVEVVQRTVDALEGWKSEPFDDCLTTEGIERRPSIPRSAYRTEGKYPVIDQGQAAIAGFTDDNGAIHRDDLPLLLFGDHTRAVKYLDFPFATGADGTKLLRPRRPDLDARFLYYALLSVELPSRGYNRHFGLLREQHLGIPEKVAEQGAIASVLSKLQSAVEVQVRIVATLDELKAATMVKLFREGLQGEPLKQTEIGEIPESWTIAPLGILTESSAFGPRFSSSLYSANGNVATLRTTDLDDAGLVNYGTMPRAKIDLRTLGSHLLRSGDLVITRSGTCGIAAVFEEQPQPVLPGAFLIRVRLLPAVSSQFLRLWINSVGKPAILALAMGAVQKNISGTSLATLVVPVPKLDEQDQIVARLLTLERTLRTAAERAGRLQKLFNEMLNALMSGEVRTPEAQARGEALKGQENFCEP